MKPTAKMATTFRHFNRLERLAKKINATHFKADRLWKTVKEKNQQLIREVIRCGKLLDKAKNLCGHGNWLTWLEDNCKGIGERTAQKYISLAKHAALPNTNHDSLLEFGSLRQAYLAFEIIPEPKQIEDAESEEEEEAPKPSLDWTPIRNEEREPTLEELEKLETIVAGQINGLVKPLKEIRKWRERPDVSDLLKPLKPFLK